MYMKSVVFNLQMSANWNSKLALGGRLNMKMLSYQYRDPNVKDKMVSRPSYL